MLYFGRNDLGNVEKQINPCLSINQQCKYSKIDECDSEDDEEEDNLEDNNDDDYDYDKAVNDSKKLLPVAVLPASKVSSRKAFISCKQIMTQVPLFKSPTF